MQKSRRDALKTLAWGSAALAANPLVLGAQRKPNVVLILVDDLGWTDAACYGSGYYETPHIDRLARQGMRFTNGYAACAVCSPTRAAVLTGRYPARVGITDWIRARFQGGKIPEDKEYPTEYVGGKNKPVLCPPNPLWMKHEEVTMAEMLKKAGYTTCHIGKWHLGPDAWYPETQGFDYNIGGCDYGQPPSYFDPYDNKRLDNIPTLKPRDKGEYLTDRLGDEAVRFMKKHKDQPFFLYMANYAVHTPIQAKESYIEKYKNKPKTENHDNAKYAGMVESVDDCVGKIMNTLDELDLADDTLIIFTGDNGGLEPVTDNAPLRAGKGHPYEGGIREPLIVRWPGKVEAGRVSDEPVTSVDFFPTICQAAGVGLPANRAIDGETMMPLLTQSGGMKRDAIYWHFPHYRGNIDPYSIIREGDWKLLKKYGKGTFELYNLKEDISETNDLAKQKPDKVKALNKKLERWLKETGAKVPIPNPNYEG